MLREKVQRKRAGHGREDAEAARAAAAAVTGTAAPAVAGTTAEAVAGTAAQARAGSAAQTVAGTAVQVVAGTTAVAPPRSRSLHSRRRSRCRSRGRRLRQGRSHSDRRHWRQRGSGGAGNICLTVLLRSRLLPTRCRVRGAGGSTWGGTPRVRWRGSRRHRIPCVHSPCALPVHMSKLVAVLAPLTGSWKLIRQTKFAGKAISGKVVLLTIGDKL